MPVTLTIDGLDEFIRDVLVMHKKAQTAMAKSLYESGEQIMTEAQRAAPVDKGFLQGSGHVKPPVIRGNTVEVVLGFGGPASAYALAVHEHPSVHSPPSWSGGVSFSGGGPKYLERPFNAASDRVNKKLAADMERALR